MTCGVCVRRKLSKWKCQGYKWHEFVQLPHNSIRVLCEVTHITEVFLKFCYLFSIFSKTLLLLLLFHLFHFIGQEFVVKFLYKNCYLTCYVLLKRLFYKDFINILWACVFKSVVAVYFSIIFSVGLIVLWIASNCHLQN